MTVCSNFQQSLDTLGYSDIADAPPGKDFQRSLNGELHPLSFIHPTKVYLPQVSTNSIESPAQSSFLAPWLVLLAMSLAHLLSTIKVKNSLKEHEMTAESQAPVK